jgi:uncharacterized membrane protein
MNKLNIAAIAAAVALVFSAGAVAINLSSDDYSAAREKCDDSAGNAKDVCVKEAKARFGQS